MGNREKSQSEWKERVLDVGCLAASYIFLLLLPKNSGVLFYLLFAASAFLFCIGFFRMGFLFRTPAGGRGGIVLLVLGTVINAGALFGIIYDRGSARSIIVATLLMIEALLFFAIAGSGVQAPEKQRRIRLALKSAAVLLIVFGIVYLIMDRFSEASVAVGTLLLIEAVCLWTMGAGKNPFNTLSPEIQTVPWLKAPLEQLRRDFAGTETQLGYPWIGRIKTVKEDCLIYGPDESGYAVYGYYLYGRFYVAGSENPLFPEPEDAEKHVVREIPDREGTLLSKGNLPEAYAGMFARYAENGEASWRWELPQNTERQE